MGLPQELIDDIIAILQDDIRALKACSLTCKAMFASPRHLIHRTLYLTVRNNQSVFTQQEKSRYEKRPRRNLELRFISYAGERGLLRYPRQLYINMPSQFTPDNILPHLHH